MPNKVANMQDVYKGVSFDPTDDHHAPWQSGMTGLGYDSAVTGDADEPRGRSGSRTRAGPARSRS